MGTIRITGTEFFVKEAGDMVVDTFKQKGFSMTDGGVKESRNPKYEGSFIRYIRIGLDKEE